MLSLIRIRNCSEQNSQINASARSDPDRVTITAPRHILEGSTLHVNVRSRIAVTMPFFPFVTLEHAPYGFPRPLNPEYTNVMRRGRGQNRRNSFVRAAPRPPPPEPRVVILRGRPRYPRYPHDPDEYCRVINTHDHPRPPPSNWPRGSCGCHMYRRPRSPHWRGGFGEPLPSSTDGISTEDFEPPRPGHGRRVHWPDGHSDGSLSSDSSNDSSDTSSESNDGPRGGGCGGGWSVPRTPSSSPDRGRPYPSPMCEDCDDMCAINLGPGYRGWDGAGGGGSRWRDAPCRERPVWDRTLGYGVERAPRR